MANPIQETIQKLAANKIDLAGLQSSNNPMSPQELSEYRLLAANAVQGNLKGIDCEECKNKGVVFVDRDGEMIACKCKCMSIRDGLNKLFDSGLTDVSKAYTFEKYQTTENWQSIAKEKSMAFADNPQGWFVAVGTVGSGKSHLSTAICLELLRKGYSTRYMLWRDESVMLKSQVNDYEPYQKLIKPLKEAQVLYIDDLFKTRKDESIKVGDINLAFEILNYRYYTHNSITIITSEKTLEEIIEIDEGIGSRIYERANGNILTITGKDKNWRLK